MNKKLKSESIYGRFERIADFINENNIPKEDILDIIRETESSVMLLYYESDYEAELRVNNEKFRELTKKSQDFVTRFQRGEPLIKQEIISIYNLFNECYKNRSQWNIGEDASNQMKETLESLEILINKIPLEKGID